MAENGAAVHAAEQPTAPAGNQQAAAAAALHHARQVPTVEQCRVLQTVIKLLEHNEDAKKMLPLASMSAEILQTTLANSPQAINVADVLGKLAPHLEPAVAAQLWEQYHKGAASGRESAAAAAKVVAAASFASRQSSDGSQIGGSVSALNQAAPLAPGAPNPAHANLKRQPYTANNKVCGCCHETYHPSFSPLILCDFCPQAYHIFCLGLDWADLPEADWACPSCLPLPAGSRGAAGLAVRQRAEADRLLALERERQERELKRAEEKLMKDAAKVKEKADKEKAKLDLKRGVKHVPDDIDLAAEEAAEAARLASLLPKLKDAAERESGGRRTGSSVAAYEEETAEGLPPLPPGGRRMGINPGALGPYGAYGAGVGAGSYMGAGMPVSASDQLREASDRLKKLQATAAGPPPLKDVIVEERVLHSLMDALAVSEFLATFSGVCGAPQLNLAQLQQAVAWPLDGPEVFEIYSCLVKYLLAQWSHIESGHVGARVRRWARCMERSSAIGDFDSAAFSNGHAPNGNATWQELLRRYCLLSRSSLRVKESQLKSGQEYATMDDDLIMVHAAVELGKQDIWKMPPEFHLRLIHALCNDVINCYNMKAEISSRLDTSIALQIEKFHADAEERKKEKEAARLRREAAQAARDKRTREMMASSTNTPGPDGVATPDQSQGLNQAGAAGDSSMTAGADDGINEPPLKRARSSSGLLDAEGGEGTPGPGEAYEGTPDPAADPRNTAGWKHGEDRDAREAALQTELMRYMIRTDPLGIDRHHQRYWHMQSDPSVIFVESSEGDTLGLITNKAQLDALVISLNKRGAREAALHQALMKNYSKFCRCLKPPAQPLDVRQVPRNRRMRRSWLRQAAKAMPANTPLDDTGYPVPQLQNEQQRAEQQVPDYEALMAESEATAVAAALSELEGLVSQLVGVGIYDLPFKKWRKKFRGKATVDELCQLLEEFEADLSKVGDGRPSGATDEAIDEFIREADIYEAEFVMPVSAAELAEQQEAAAAAAAAAKAEKAEHGDGDDLDIDPEDAKVEEPVAPPKSASKSRSKKASSNLSSKKGKSAVSSKKGGKKGAAAADDDDANPDAAAHKGPMVTLFSGATRVRKAGHVKQEVKQEPGAEGGDPAAAGGDGSMDVDGGLVKQEGGKEQDLTKMVSPLEELDDSDVEAEKRYQEKRAAEKAGEPIPPPPVVLWRSTRELGVWVKDLRRARMTGALGGAAYAAAALVDRTHRLMSNLALAKIRTGVAAAIAEDRDIAVQRKSELLLGPTPFDPASLLSPEDLKAQQAAQTPEPTMVTSTGRRIKGVAEPRRKMSARQRVRRGTPGEDDEWYMYGDEYGGFEAEPDEPPPPPPEGKWGLACVVCGGGGEVACCEVPGCSVLMHLSCAGMPDADFYYCPDHMLAMQQPWMHAVQPPGKYQAAHPPPVRPVVP